MDGYVVNQVFVPKLGDKYRILIPYRTGLRAFIWFRVGRDGSIYLGPYIPRANTARFGKLDTKVSDYVSYEDGTPIDVEGQKNISKVSIHASGVVHALSKRAFRSSFQTLTEQIHLASILFQSPLAYPLVPLKEVRKTDMVSKFNIAQDRPMQCLVYLRPNRGLSPLEVTEARQQEALMMNYDSLPQGKATLIFQFLDGKVCRWPPMTYMVMKAEPDGTSFGE